MGLLDCSVGSRWCLFVFIGALIVQVSTIFGLCEMLSYACAEDDRMGQFFGGCPRRLAPRHKQIDHGSEHRVQVSLRQGQDCRHFFVLRPGFCAMLQLLCDVRRKHVVEVIVPVDAISIQEIRFPASSQE